MKVAVYHNLPSGGGKRALYDFIRTTCDNVHYDLYRFDTPENEAFLDIRPLVKNVFDYPLRMPGFPRWAKGVRLINPLLELQYLQRAQRQIAHDIDSGGYDLVFVHHCRFTQAPALLSYLKTPSVYYLQEPRRRSFEYDFIEPFKIGGDLLNLARSSQQAMTEAKIKQLDVAASRAAVMVLCNSYYSAESIYRAYGISSQVSYLGVDTAVFKPPVKPSADRPYALSVGALHPAKGHDFAIRALGLIPPPDRLTLKVVCDRSLSGYEQELGALAREHQVNLDILHGVSDSDLVGLYQSAVAVLCTAHLEPFGYTPVEAQSCGTPVVAVREGGYKETVVDGRNGYSADRRPQQFAAALEKVLHGKLFDPQKLHVQAEKQWSLRAAADRLMNHFEEAIADEDHH